MNRIFEAAEWISTPSAIGGFFALIFILVLRQLAGTLRSHGQRKYMLSPLIKYGQIFAMLSIATGFLGYTITIARAPLPLAEDSAAEGKINLRFRNASLRDILESVARQAKVVLAIDSRLEARTMSIEAHNSPLAEIMNTICEASSCEWRILDGNPPALLVTPKE